jgi:hypothetical protein
MTMVDNIYFFYLVLVSFFFAYVITLMLFVRLNKQFCTIRYLLATKKLSFYKNRVQNKKQTFILKYRVFINDYNILVGVENHTNCRCAASVVT